MEKIDPLTDLAPEVEAALLKAGWRPDAKRNDNVGSTGSRSLAGKVLASLHDLKVQPPVSTGTFRPLGVNFDPTIAYGYEAAIKNLGRCLNVELVPIGSVGGGLAILLMAETGHLLLLGYAEPGLMLAGKSFSEGMKRILLGEPMPAIQPSIDPDGICSLEPAEAAGLSIIYLGPKGLAGLN